MRQVQSTAERIEAARAGAAVARQRLDVEQRRYEVGLSTSFLVTQAQRDLLQTEVNLLQATLDHQSALVSFEALQQAPALGKGQPADSTRGSNVIQLGPSAPTGLFRTRIHHRILILNRRSGDQGVVLLHCERLFTRRPS